MTTNYGLRSSGLLVFAGRMASAFTGLLFALMTARWLDPASLGTWKVIVTLVTFAAYPVGLVAYWATRDVARGKLVGRTALAGGGLLSAGGLVIYFAFTFVTYPRIGASVLPFLLGALLVPLSYWSAVANSIVQGFRPRVFAYSLVISELAKLGTALVALYVYGLGIEGVILALMAAYFVQSAVSTYLVRATATQRFEVAQVRRWSRLAWLPALSYLPPVLAATDSYVAAVGFGTAIVGQYLVAFVLASVVGYASGLAFSLYPLLLRGGGERLPAATMEFSLLFSLPMAVGLVVLSGPIIFLFGPKYLPAAFGLAVLSGAFLITTISDIVDQTLLGTEKADLGERPSFRDLARSNLIFVPVANMGYAIVYVTAMYATLYFSFAGGASASTSIAAWASVQFAATVIFLAIKARRATRYAKLLPEVNVVKYLVSAAIMGAVVYYISGPLLPTNIDAVSYGLNLVGVVGIGIVVYFALVFVLDAKFRRTLIGVLP